MTHSTHLVYGYMVKDHLDIEKGNLLPPFHPFHEPFFPISSKVFFYIHHPIGRIAHTTALVKPDVEH